MEYKSNEDCFNELLNNIRNLHQINDILTRKIKILTNDNDKLMDINSKLSLEIENLSSEKDELIRKLYHIQSQF